MKKIILSLLVTLVSFSTTITAQEDDKKPIIEKKATNKGKFYAFWGWNVSNYSNSDIAFKGDDYNFTLNSVKATDRQTPFSFDVYFNPTTISIPQTNYGIGYFFHENYNVFIGVDHMKYVMVQDQEVGIDGKIGSTHGSHAGDYNNGAKKVLSDDFLTFEHTDGLNYVYTAVNRFDDISEFIGIETENFRISITEGIGAGMLFPKTNAKLMNNERYDEFHVAGFGLSAQVGLNLTFFKYFFLESDLKAGYINMGDIRTTSSSADKASQSFTYTQANIIFGGRFGF